MDAPQVAIVGAGFAGSEAAWQLARRGHAVRLYEMRPRRMTEAHQSGDCAELVCSNSFKSISAENAHGLLKAELAVQGSLILEVAHETAVPAGQALAVDREQFARRVTARLEAEPLVEFCRDEARSAEALLAAHRAVIVASGPLTSPELAESLRAYVGEGYLYFHDAIAPVVMADSIDRSVAFAASRYGKGTADYLNCPLSETEYHAFVTAVAAAEKVAFHSFESLRPFEGCLPIEVMVERGPLTLAYGPMKPVGLTDPRTGRRPFAALQLRCENAQGTLYSMVGCQTKMTWPEQRRVFRMIPGLEHAQFARLGSLHRNTFLNAPRLLDEDLALRDEPRLFFAGQITGVEGYMESTAMGLYVAKRIAARLDDVERPRPGSATMTGALLRYLRETPPERFQPMNASFGLLDAAPDPVHKRERKAFYARRALAEMERLEALERPLTPVAAASTRPAAP
ncbi:MAG TPA: methylenetetrahydrofolate--tRNA-(uracil(54)-C(5))-methyltransferase (FADH(2)-oxidizing) TrmFO [bacterium]|nr:methylenetetrahydrofolate--tRNA-(uracil(54)-C(5))-methyltransferase (FADH(2)-oxidizing) TrmFO [bacterium]